MNNVELRAPKRHIKKEKDQLLPILCAVVAIGVAGFVFLKNVADDEQMGNESTGVVRDGDATPIKDTPAPLPAATMPQPAPKGRITTEGGRTYYVPESAPVYQDGGEPTAEDRYKRASQIMAQSRQIQRRIDSQMYGGGDVSSLTTGGASQNSNECKSIKDEKERLDERMRRYGYGNATGEQLHEQWRQLNQAMIRFHCH